MSDQLCNNSNLLDFQPPSFRMKITPNDQSMIHEKTVVSSDFSAYFNRFSEEKPSMLRPQTKTSQYRDSGYKRERRRSKDNVQNRSQTLFAGQIKNSKNVFYPLSQQGSNDNFAGNILNEIPMNLESKRAKLGHGSSSLLNERETEKMHSLNAVRAQVKSKPKGRSQTRERGGLEKKPRVNRTSIVQSMKITSNRDENRVPKRHINFLNSGSEDMLTGNFSRMTKTEITRLMTIYGDYFQQHLKVRGSSGLNNQRSRSNLKNQRDTGDIRYFNKNYPKARSGLVPASQDLKHTLKRSDRRNFQISKHKQTLLGKRSSDNLLMVESFHKLGSFLDSETQNNNIFLHNSLVVSNSDFGLSVNEFRENSFMKQFKSVKRDNDTSSFQFGSKELGLGSNSLLNCDPRVTPRSQNLDDARAIKFGSFKCKINETGWPNDQISQCLREREQEMSHKIASSQKGNEFQRPNSQHQTNPQNQNKQTLFEPSCNVNKKLFPDTPFMNQFNLIVNNGPEFIQNLQRQAQRCSNPDNYQSSQTKMEFLHHLNNIQNYFVDVENQSIYLKIGSMRPEQRSGDEKVEERNREFRATLVPFKDFLATMQGKKEQEEPVQEKGQKEGDSPDIQDLPIENQKQDIARQTG